MKQELKEIFGEAELKLEESKDKNILAGLRFNFVKADKMNSNGYDYSEELMSKETKRYNEELQKSGISGQLNHPQINATELDKISHVITKVSYDSKTKFGVAEAKILNTAKGRDLLTLINSNVKLGASMRGFGSVDKARKTVNSDYRLRTIDLVENPSYGADTEITKQNLLIESGNQLFEFFSLRDSLNAEVKERFGTKAWVIDFSDSEVVFKVEDSEEYQKIDYAVKDNKVSLGKAAKVVQKKIQYEQLKEKYLEAAGAGYQGSIDDFQKLVEQNRTFFDESDLSLELAVTKTVERENLYARYEQALLSGYSGSFDDFRLLMAKGPKAESEQEKKKKQLMGVFDF